RQPLGGAVQHGQENVEHVARDRHRALGDEQRLCSSVCGARDESGDGGVLERGAALVGHTLPLRDRHVEHLGLPWRHVSTTYTQIGGTSRGRYASTGCRSMPAVDGRCGPVPSRLAGFSRGPRGLRKLSTAPKGPKSGPEQLVYVPGGMAERPNAPAL